MKSISLSEKDAARFWSKVKVGNPDECWEWTAHKNNTGYGIFGLGNGKFLASRISWTVKYGPIEKGMCVCHKCDNPACVNPSHLFLGTIMENVHDKMRKGRYVKGLIYRGESNKSAKLTEKDILEIRTLYDNGISTRKIAVKFKVGASTIWSACKRVSWSHVK